jgi:putative nucleotidyltransferase with HDIG domain
MSTVAVEQLKAGMVLASDVFIFENKLLLPKDTELTDYMIHKLEFYSIKEVKVKDSAPSEAATPASSENESYSQRLKHSQEFKEFKEEFFKNLYVLKTDFLDIANKDKKIEPEEFLDRVDSIIEHAGSQSVFDMLHCMREYDDSTFVHALNTALICHTFGHWIGLNEEDLNALTLAGLLHDIGKIRVSDTIIKKTERLSPTERTMMQAHTVYGYEILKNQDIDERVKLAALMHHEHCDGTGYPKACEASQITDFAKIVGIIADYDSLTSARPYREALCPFEVIKKFELEGLQKYDPSYIMTFLEHVSNAFINHTVRLSNGETAEIVMINKQFLSRPMVKTESRFIDLTKETNLSIEAII